MIQNNNLKLWSKNLCSRVGHFYTCFIVCFFGIPFCTFWGQNMGGGLKNFPNLCVKIGELYFHYHITCMWVGIQNNCFGYMLKI